MLTVTRIVFIATIILLIACGPSFAGMAPYHRVEFHDCAREYGPWQIQRVSFLSIMLPRYHQLHPEKLTDDSELAHVIAQSSFPDVCGNHVCVLEFYDAYGHHACMDLKGHWEQ